MYIYIYSCLKDHSSEQSSVHNTIYFYFYLRIIRQTQIYTPQSIELFSKYFENKLKKMIHFQNIF